MTPRDKVRLTGGCYIHKILLKSITHAKKTIQNKYLSHWPEHTSMIPIQYSFADFKMFTLYYSDDDGSGDNGGGDDDGGGAGDDDDHDNEIMSTGPT